MSEICACKVCEEREKEARHHELEIMAKRAEKALYVMIRASEHDEGMAEVEASEWKCYLGDYKDRPDVRCKILKILLNGMMLTGAEGGSDKALTDVFEYINSIRDDDAYEADQNGHVTLIEDVKSLQGLSFGKGCFDHHYVGEDLRLIKENPKRSFVHIQRKKGAIMIWIPDKNTECKPDVFINRAEFIRVGGLFDTDEWRFVVSDYNSDGERRNRRLSRSDTLNVYLEKAMCVFHSFD